MSKLPIRCVIAIALGFGSGRQPSLAELADPPPLEPPALGPLVQPGPSDQLTVNDSRSTVKSLHEATLLTPQVATPVHIDKAPPTTIADRPGIDAPETGAQWVDGYWDWDEEQKDFVWVTGTWRVSPPGRFWVNGSWKRDEQGWYRVPGFWSERKTDVRRDGPPSVGREDRTGPAPSPDSFLIPGQYVPAGDGVVWRPGFWARSQPGWEWVPARWVRLSEGWTYREGHWERSTADL